MPTTTRCDRCGAEYGFGEWPLCPHGRVLKSKGFEPHFDLGLGREVTGWGDIHQAMRAEHLDYRDHPDPARRLDRLADQKRRASCR